MVHSLGSRTSGVDGSSEGGRINTIDIPGALVIYGVALLQSLQPRNPKVKLNVAPCPEPGDSARIRPPIASTRALAIVSPMPEPPTARLRDLSTR